MKNSASTYVAVELIEGMSIDDAAKACKKEATKRLRGAPTSIVSTAEFEKDGKPFVGLTLLREWES
jgi:NifU-like protein involved in Fe-S cluster formation